MPVSVLKTYWTVRQDRQTGSGKISTGSYHSEGNKINPAKLVGHFSFVWAAKYANNKLFKDVCNEAEMEENNQIA